MTNRRSFALPLAVGLFAGGFLCGTMSQRRADAQMGDLGGKALEAAGGAGGTVGAAAKLGTSITDMQSNIDALQKNMEILKQIKSALGG